MFLNFLGWINLVFSAANFAIFLAGIDSFCIFVAVVNALCAWVAFSVLDQPS